MQSLFSRWVRKNKNKFDKASAFELKITKTEKLYYKQVKSHQYHYLEESTKDGTYHKISDQSLDVKPYDCFLLKGDAYVVLMFFKPKKKKIAYLIPIKNFNIHREYSSKKFITEHECESISTLIAEL